MHYCAYLFYARMGASEEGCDAANIFMVQSWNPLDILRLDAVILEQSHRWVGVPGG